MSSDKRIRILQAAIRVFTQRGFCRAKIVDIAKEAELATGTVYLYFENKDALFIPTLKWWKKILILPKFY